MCVPFQHCNVCTACLKQGPIHGSNRPTHPTTLQCNKHTTPCLQSTLSKDTCLSISHLCLPIFLQAGCCFADASGQPTCKNMSQEECIARSGLAFSPGLPCARRPCEHAVVKKNAAGEGPLGTCNVRRRCFELIHQGVCRNREGVGFSNDPCRALQAAMHPACYGEPKAVPLPPFVGP